jgi:hypothetical protein
MARNDKRAQLRELAKEAEQQGWTVTQRKNGHYMWTAPNGKKVFSASTPSDPRAFKNHLSTLRKYGFVERKP